jgi:lipopolysaccharide transport system permease protein
MHSKLFGWFAIRRVKIPASSVVVASVGFLISVLILLLMMVWFHFLPSWRILTLPRFTLLAFVASLGPGLIITALNLRSRDF